MRSDLIQLPLHSAVYMGDAFTLLKRMQPGSVQLLLSDPPYNVSKSNNFRKSMGRRGLDFGEWDRAFDQFGWLDDAVEALAPAGAMVIWNDWKLLGFIAAQLESMGMVVKRQLRWRKKNPFPRNILRTPVQGDEYALWAVKRTGSKCKGWTFKRRPGYKYERGEFEYPVVQGSSHPTKKPDGLFQDIIEMFSKPGDLVLDPFAGTGTTAVAAQRTGRRHISFELEPSYFKLACDALEQVVPITHMRKTL